jgi:hypothetical protein
VFHLAGRAIRTAAVLFALTWLVFPGFGLADLMVTSNASWPVVLEAGWGLLFTVLGPVWSVLSILWGIAFAAMATVTRPDHAHAPLQTATADEGGEKARLPGGDQARRREESPHPTPKADGRSRRAVHGHLPLMHSRSS